MKCSVMVIHFKKDFLGNGFWELPESREIEKLLNLSMLAVKVADGYKTELATAIQQLENADGFERITLLC